jgi:hypothetical protein
MLVDYWYNATKQSVFWMAAVATNVCNPGRSLGWGNESPTSAVSLASDYLHAAEIRTFAFLL